MTTSSTIRTIPQPATGTATPTGALRGVILLQLIRLLEAMWLLSSVGIATPIPGAAAWGWSDIVITATALVAFMVASDNLPGSRSYVTMWNTACVAQTLIAIACMISATGGTSMNLSWFFAPILLASHGAIILCLYRTPAQRPADLSTTTTLTSIESW